MKMAIPPKIKRYGEKKEKVKLLLGSHFLIREIESLIKNLESEPLLCEDSFVKESAHQLRNYSVTLSNSLKNLIKEEVETEIKTLQQTHTQATALMSNVENYAVSKKKEKENEVLSKPAKNTHNFKLAYGYRKKCYRLIEVREDQTLVSLHNAIQRAINWNNDHLYAFYLSGKLKDYENQYLSPDDQLGPEDKCADTQLRLLNLKEGQKIKYLFDFGDCNVFDILVVGKGTIDEGKDYPVIVESKGKSPEQYSY